MQLANHCNKALDKETLSLLYPLGDFSHTKVNISASNLSGVYIKRVFIGAYTKITMVAEKGHPRLIAARQNVNTAR